MNRKQVAWAAQHDWYRDAIPVDASGSWTVKVAERVEQFNVTTGEVVGYSEAPRYFTSFAKLQSWAGY